MGIAGRELALFMFSLPPFLLMRGQGPAPFSMPPMLMNSDESPMNFVPFRALFLVNFRESPECELRLLSSSTKFGHPLVTPSSGRPGTPQASEGTHAPAADPNLQTYHRRRSGHLRENGRRRSARRR